MLRIAEIHFYLVKGCRGSSAKKAQLTQLGLEHDRRFMLIDPEGNFVSQRNAPEMALIQADLIRGSGGLPRLSLSHGTGGNYEVDIPQNGDLWSESEQTVWDVRIHGKPAKAVDIGDEPSAWFSDTLGTQVRLVHQTEHTPRKRKNPIGGAEYGVSFADAFPLLVTSHASLEALNIRLSEAGHQNVGMDRFRPNIVLCGSDGAFAEDTVGHVSIGETAEIISATQCTRCTVPDVNQQSGVFDPDRTVFEMLKTIHSVPGKGVCFGVNAIVKNPGKIKVGDSLEVVQW